MITWDLKLLKNKQTKNAISEGDQRKLELKRQDTVSEMVMGKLYHILSLREWERIHNGEIWDIFIL